MRMLEEKRLVFNLYFFTLENITNVPPCSIYCIGTLYLQLCCKAQGQGKGIFWFSMSLLLLNMSYQINISNIRGSTSNSNLPYSQCWEHFFRLLEYQYKNTVLSLKKKKKKKLNIRKTNSSQEFASANRVYACKGAEISSEEVVLQWEAQPGQRQSVRRYTVPAVWCSCNWLAG